MKNYYSAHCALGWVGPQQTLRARILRALDPRLRVHDDLEAFFAPALSQQKEAALKRWSNEDDDDIFLANERQHFAPDMGFEGRKGGLVISCSARDGGRCRLQRAVRAHAARERGAARADQAAAEPYRRHEGCHRGMYHACLIV